MRLLVLGGSRFLSRAVAAEGVRRGHEVLCACRGASGPLPPGVRHVPLDRSSAAPASALASLGPVDAVVDPARLPSWVRSALAALPEAHWLFVSTISVYADHATPGGGPGTLPTLDPVDEDRDPSADLAAYGGMKVACERAVLTGARSALVVRPGLVVGPGDPTGRFSYWPARLAEPGPVLAPGSPDDPVQVVDARDLAAWLVRAAEERTTGTYDAVGPLLRRAELLDQVTAGVAAGVAAGEARPDLVWVPSDRLLAAGVDPWSGPRSLPLWLGTPEYAGMMAHDPAPAYDAGLRTRPLADTARDTLAWLREDRDAPVTGLTRIEEAEVLRAIR